MARFISMGISAVLFACASATAGTSLYVSSYDAEALGNVASEGVIQPFVPAVPLPGRAVIEAEGNMYVGNERMSGTVAKIAPECTASAFATGINDSVWHRSR
jgi:hypothetical protein